MKPTARILLMIPAFFVSIFLERCILYFFWRSEPSIDRKRFVWRANVYSYVLLIVFALIWLLYAILDLDYHPEI